MRFQHRFIRGIHKLSESREKEPGMYVLKSVQLSTHRVQGVPVREQPRVVPAVLSLGAGRRVKPGHARSGTVHFRSDAHDLLMVRNSPVGVVISREWSCRALIATSLFVSLGGGRSFRLRILPGLHKKKRGKVDN